MSEEWRLHEDLQGEWRIRDGKGQRLATVATEEAARLMVTAPKLLAALEKLLKHAGSLHTIIGIHAPELGQPDTKALDRARAAIEEARV